MIVRLTAVTTLIALFALSFSLCVDNARQRSMATMLFHDGGQDCLADGLFCAPGGNRAVN